VQSVAHYRPLAASVPSARADSVSTPKTLAFLALHFPLGVWFYQDSRAATVHALVVICWGLFLALTTSRLQELVAVGAYIVGGEVLWRMTDAAIFWEFAKYGVCLLFGLALLRIWIRGGLRGGSGVLLPAVYLALLLPGAAMTFLDFDFGLARRAVSFNLSGPLSIAVCAMALSRIELSKRQLQRALVAGVGPILAVASITLFTTYTADDINWSASSNFITSGGYGPNQVSSALSIGALFLFYLMLSARQGFLGRLLLLGLMVLCSVQSVMTFSRTGIYLVFGSIGVTLWLLMRQSRSGAGLKPVLLTAAFLGGLYLAASNLNQFTEGALERRYQDTSSTHRYEIALSDLELFMRHPLLGVGVGQAPFEREFFTFSASHTELTRLLAEHGLPGAVAIFLLTLILFNNFRAKTDALSRAFALGAATWIMLFLLVSGMRLAMPGFLFGLIAATSSVPPPRPANQAAPRKEAGHAH